MLVGAEQLTCGAWLPGGCSAGGSSSATLAPEPCAVPGGGAAARPGEPSGGRPRTPSTWAEDTHLEHDFIDGSSVGFKVEVFIVVIA